jgi:hypothetical protein
MPVEGDFENDFAWLWHDLFYCISWKIAFVWEGLFLLTSKNFLDDMSGFPYTAETHLLRDVKMRPHFRR